MPNFEQPVILFRQEFDDGDESVIAAAHLPVVSLRAAVPPNSLVIGRYACLPYYRELAADLAHNGSCLINSPEQHTYIANFDYYNDIREHTFPTWFAFHEVPAALREGHAFVVKGRTNSRKLQWATHMHAPSWRSAVQLGSDLANDPFIGPQGLIVRQYVPLETLEYGINDMPITNEWRLFFYKDTLLASGYYWAIIDDESKVDVVRPDFEAQGIPFAKMVARVLAERANFFVIDIARTAAGEWKVVEVNDGQQSGLNHYVQAEELYANLAAALAEDAQVAKAFAAMNVCGTRTGRCSSKDLNVGGTPRSADLQDVLVARAQAPVGDDPLLHFDSSQTSEQIRAQFDQVVARAATVREASAPPRNAQAPKRCMKCGEMDFRHPYRNCDTPE